MTTRHVAVFMFPGYGHVNPTLEISRCLIALGHRVTYVLDEKFAAPVTAIGAEVVRYTSQRSRLGKGTVTGEDIGALGLTFLRESMDVILPRTLEAFEDDVPDLVLYDLESFFTARTAARRWGRPTVQLFPYVAANEHYALSLEVFDGTSESLQKCLDLIMEHLAAEDTDPETAATFLANFDSRNVVLLPKSFQPLGETFDDRYTFTGHSLPADRSGTGSWQHPSGGGPVALITLGTEVNDRPDFFTDCVEAFDGSDWHLVMAVGPGNLPACRAAAQARQASRCTNGWRSTPCCRTRRPWCAMPASARCSRRSRSANRWWSSPTRPRTESTAGAPRNSAWASHCPATK